MLLLYTFLCSTSLTSSGKLELTPVHQHENQHKQGEEEEEEETATELHHSLLKSDHCFIFDFYTEIFAWLGRKASVLEKQVARQFAQALVCTILLSHAPRSLSI